MKTLMRFVAVLIVLVCWYPGLAFAQEATIITPVVPPPSTNWMALVAVGAGYTFGIVALIRQLQPKIDGRVVYVLVVPIALAVAVYQVGFADLKLLAKHAGLLLLTTYGGTAGLRKLGAWMLAAYAAYSAGTTIPPAPDLEEPATVSIPKPSRLPPPLPLLLCLAMLACAGCNLTPQQAATADKVLSTAVDTGLELADHICEATGRHRGFVDFACTFIGSLAPDNGKDGAIILGPERPPIRVSVPDALAEDFGKRHSPETLARSEGGE